jgi:hypothetical protein
MSSERIVRIPIGPFVVTQRQPVVASIDARLFGLSKGAISTERKPFNDSILRQWSIFTEKVRRAISTNNVQVCTALQQYITQPLSEMVPDSFFATLSVLIADPTSPKEFALLQEVLRKSPIEEDIIVPDIRNAKVLEDPNNVVYGARAYVYIQRGMFSEDLQDALKGPIIFDQGIQQVLDDNPEVKAITGEEKNLVAGRFRMAREVKLLAFAAAIKSTNDIKQTEGETMYSYNFSGIQLHIAKDRFDEDFLHPEMWERRKIVKDRAWEVIINGKSYMMKEQKTSCHTDTRGPTDTFMKPLSSEEEFYVAQRFLDGKAQYGSHVSVRWEKPIGYVTFPDGYQFVLYDFEKGLQDEQNIVDNLRETIITRPDTYRATYEMVKHQYQTFPYDWWVELTREQQGDMPRELSYETFAEIFARWMLDKGMQGYLQVRKDKNLFTTDHDGFGYKISNEGNLEFIAFDMEYYVHSDLSQAERLLSIDTQDWVVRSRENNNAILPGEHWMEWQYLQEWFRKENISDINRRMLYQCMRSL